jgi:hypothetical protein
MKGEFLQMEMYRENGLKKIEWENSNKMKFESGHKTFDKQTNCLSTGNVISNTQLSFYIRSAKETINPVGQEVPEGHLRDFDLRQFNRLPSHVERFVKRVTEDKQVILYEFRHFNGNNKVVDGYVVTDTDYNHIQTFFMNNRAYKAVIEARKYIARMN